MQDETKIKLIGAGLILVTVIVVLVVFSKNMTPQTQTLEVTPIVQVNPVPTPSVSPAIQGAKSLPKTGFPAGLFVIFSASAVLIGYGFRKFPH